MTQEQLNQLSREIVKVSRQIEILNGPEFADTVPQVEDAKQALIAYKNEAEAQIRAHQAQAAAAAPAAASAANPFGQINMQALGQLVAALQQAGTAPAAPVAPAPQAAVAANPLASLLATLAQSAVPAAQG